jgi:hypothetical protein
MLLFWRIRYLDRRDKLFKDRDLWLDTEALDLGTKAAVEATYELKDHDRERGILRFRRLFRERNDTAEGFRALCESRPKFGGFCIPFYFEDETGQELTLKQMAVTLSGNHDAMLFPPGTRPHDIAYDLAEKSPIRIDQVALAPEQLTTIGYFVRDLRELLTTAFNKEGPGTLTGPCSDGGYRLQTAVSDEEIRSFLTIFRRLYMENEPANFVKAVATFHQALQGHPLADWVRENGRQYENELKEAPDATGMVPREKLSFSRKRLIDVFLNTKYAHQPDQRRSRQYQECLATVAGHQSLLTWLFLTEVWNCALHMRSSGATIAQFYDAYCRCHKVTGDVLPSVQCDQPGLGALEKKEAREARILREKAEEVAKARWEKAGRPEGGHTPFVTRALEELTAATRRTA